MNIKHKTKNVSNDFDEMPLTISLYCIFRISNLFKNITAFVT